MLKAIINTVTGPQPDLTGATRAEATSILSCERRNLAIEYISSVPDEEIIPLGDIVEYVAGKENGCKPRNLTSKQRKRVYTATKQSHMPILEDAGIVKTVRTEYGVVRDTEFRKGENARDFRLLVDYTSDVTGEDYIDE